MSFLKITLTQNQSFVLYFIYPMKKPEILSPIQDIVSLKAAINAGADAVYFGIRGFNMRATAKNFTVEDLPRITKTAHDSNIRAYLALNTIIYNEEIDEMRNVLQKAKDANIDAVICWDTAVVRSVQELGLETHLSTQASVSNSEAALFYKDLGITRIVLARECSLEQIKKIKEKTDIEIEIFIHGAMCVSISGRCFMSQFSTGNSANRGACRQPCRRNYIIKDVEDEFEYEIGPDYVLSPKDLCTLPFIEKLVFSGIDCFKIEGRNKSPEYVSDVTSAYREVIDFIWNNKDKQGDETFKKDLAEMKERLIKKLKRVFNRGFSGGFYMGKPLNEWTDSYGNAGTERKIFLGKITHVYDKIKVAELKIDTNQTIRTGDEIFIQGAHTGNYRTTIRSMEIDHKQIKQAEQGNIIAIKIDTKVRCNDMVYRIEKIKTD